MKLHPLSIPYRVAQSALGLLWLAFFAVFGIGSVAEGAAAVVLFGVLIIGAVAALTGWHVAYYRRYEYELTEDTFDIGSGVLSRTEREIPYDRIQNVSIERNVVQRVLGLAEVMIETAGGAGSEAHLRYVGGDEAQRLQDELSERKRRERRTAEEETAEPEPAERLFEIQGSELLVLGLVALDSRLVPVILFALAPFFPTLRALVVGAVGTAYLLAPVAVVGLYLLTAALSAAYSVTNYYGFTLYRGEDELRYERGLLQRFSGTIPLAKVQAVTITENPLARLAGYASLYVETAGFSPGETGGSQAAVPIAKRERVVELTRDIEPVDIPELERPPKRARERYVFRYLGVLAITTGIVYAGVRVGLWDVRWWLAAAGLPLVPVAAHLKWRNLGYALTDEYVITRKGFWNRSTKVIPYHRIQTVADSQTIFQRRRRLATLTVDVAGSRSLVSDDSQAVDIDREVADDLRERIADRLLDALEEAQHERRRRLRERRRRLAEDLGGPATPAADGGAADEERASADPTPEDDESPEGDR